MRRFSVFALALALAVAVVPPGASNAADPVATDPFAAANFCPLSTHVREVDDTHTLYAVSFRAFETGRASGIVALWAGDRRYDVPFRDATALDSRDRISPETAIVVRFPAPTVLDGAVVTAIDEAGTLRPCDPWYSPWVSGMRLVPARLAPEDRAVQERFLSRARVAVPIDAPVPVADATTCAIVNRPGRTVYASEPNRPRFGGNGVAVVLVVLDTADKIAGARIQRSAGNRQLDDVALNAARSSEFLGQIFRCRHVMGGYLFTVEFNP